MSFAATARTTWRPTCHRQHHAAARRSAHTSSSFRCIPSIPHAESVSNDESSRSSGRAAELPRCCLNVPLCRPSCESWSSSCAHPKGLGGSSGCARYLSHAQNQSAASGAQANRASAAAMRGGVLRSLPGEEGSFARNPSEPAAKLGAVNTTGALGSMNAGLARSRVALLVQDLA